MASTRIVLFIASAAALVLVAGLEAAYGKKAHGKPGASVQEGKRVFARRQCGACHQAGGTGGCLAPPLDGAKRRRGADFIACRITDSAWHEKRFLALTGGGAELMPHPRLPGAEAEAVTAYIVSLPEPAGGYVVPSHKVPSPANSGFPAAAVDKSSSAAARGKKLYYESGCSSCHAIGNVGGQFAPRLDGVKDRRTAESVAGHVRGGELQIGQSGSQPPRMMMPPADLSPEEVAAITAFLMSLPRLK